MNTEFIDLLPPNANEYYTCNFGNGKISSGFTHLMKLVLCVKKFPESINLIEKIVCETPDEIDKKNTNGWTALMLACTNCETHSDIATVKLLLNHGANIEKCNNARENSLMLACVNSNKCSSNECVKILIDTGVNINYYFGELNRTYLMTTCGCVGDGSNCETVKLLIDANANVNFQDIYGRTSLMMTTDYYTIKMLIDAGADVNMLDYYGSSVLMRMCCRYENKIENKCIKLLIKSGADINYQTTNGFTAIMGLCRWTNKHTNELIKILLDANAGVNHSSITNSNPLSLYLSNCTKENIDVDILIRLIIKSVHLLKINIPEIGTCYDIYKSKHMDLLDEYHLRMLKGDIKWNRTKSANSANKV